MVVKLKMEMDICMELKMDSETVDLAHDRPARIRMNVKTPFSSRPNNCGPQQSCTRNPVCSSTSAFHAVFHQSKGRRTLFVYLDREEA